jgi:hypothetical protein
MPAKEAQHMRDVTDIAREKLEKAKVALSLLELVEEMSALGMTAFEARRAVMRLVDSQEAVLTRFGKIKARKGNIRRRQKLRRNRQKASA